MQTSPDTNTSEQATPRPKPQGVPSGRAMHLVYVCALAATVVGLYFGIRYSPTLAQPLIEANALQQALPQEAPEEQAHPATAYSDIPQALMGPNAHWHSALPDQQSIEALWKYASTGTTQDKLNTLSDMADRRAFHGAPPTIPHAVDPIEHISCISCHGPNGMRLGNEIVASPMPHPHYASCTQCHVPEQSLTHDETRWLENGFAGLAEPTTGQRAWQGAPPTIPHATHMRTSCISCHGPNGESGLQSSHPWRTSCTQCHAPSGQLNQQPGAEDLIELFQQYNLPSSDE